MIIEATLCGAVWALVAIAIWRAILAFQHHRSVIRELRLLEYELDDL